MCLGGGSSKPKNNYYNNQVRNSAGGYGTATLDTNSDGVAEKTTMYDDQKNVIDPKKLDKKRKRLTDGTQQKNNDLQIPT
jgi:hypothetical protein